MRLESVQACWFQNQQGRDGTLMLLSAEGTSVTGPILEIGNTNSRYWFLMPIRKFVNDWNAQGPAHHCAVGIGHLNSRIQKLGALLGMDTVSVC